MANKSSPLGVIVSCVAVVESRFSVKIVTSVADGVVVCKRCVCAADYCAVTPCIIGILCDFVTVFVTDRNYVTEEVTLVIIRLQSSGVVAVHKTYNTRLVVEIDYPVRVRCRTVLERLGTGLLGDPAAMVTLSREAHRGINPSDLRV